jgi:hypothetical protein
MSQSTMFSSCPGCYPIYQANQLAHMEPGGCLWCDYQVENSQLTVEGSLDMLFEEPMVSKEDKKAVNECCICYETIDSEKNNCVTECGHRFCFKCLATSMAHNNCTCPCCRSPLVESSEDSDEESSEYESDSETDIEVEQQYEDNDDECEIGELSARLESNGFKMQDILSMLIGRYVKGSTDMAIFEMNKKFDEIIDDADNEAVENIEMGKEDIRSIELVLV